MINKLQVDVYTINQYFDADNFSNTLINSKVDTSHFNLLSNIKQTETLKITVNEVELSDNVFGFDLERLQFVSTKQHNRYLAPIDNGYLQVDV